MLWNSSQTKGTFIKCFKLLWIENFTTIQCITIHEISYWQSCPDPKNCFHYWCSRLAGESRTIRVFDFNNLRKKHSASVIIRWQKCHNRVIRVVAWCSRLFYCLIMYSGNMSFVNVSLCAWRLSRACTAAKLFRCRHTLNILKITMWMNSQMLDKCMFRSMLFLWIQSLSIYCRN